MIKGRKIIQAIIGLILIATFPLPTTAVSIFTGDVPADFAESDAIIIIDNSTEDAEPDVDIPSPPYAVDAVSGWDVNAIYMEYEPALDMMFVGIDCFTICGDADDDGNPNRSGSAMRSASGTDVANLGRFESIALLFDTNDDYRSFSEGDFEIVVGVSQPDDLDTLGVYKFTGATRAPYVGFGERLANAVTIYSIPNARTPDLEFGIADFSQLPGLDFEPGEAFSLRTMLYAGSQRDGKIGEEYVPARGQAALAKFEKSATGSSTGSASVDSASNQVAQVAQPTPTLASPTPTALPPTPTPRPLSTTPPQRLQLPSIGVDTIVEPMGWSRIQQDDGTFATDWDVVDNAAGWHRNSALPNKSGNVVLSGHNTIGGSVFRNLFELKDGDEIVIWQDNEPFEYEIDQVMILPEQYATHAQRVENAQFMNDFGDERITLISCWPPGSASHRVVVIGKPAK